MISLDVANPEAQLAQSIKYSSALVWHFAEPSPGLFALYNHERQLVLLTRDFAELLQTYRARPAYVAPVRTSVTKTKYGLLDLDFNI